MPYAPPRICNRCNQPTPKGKPCPCRPAWENSTHPGGKTDMRMRRSMDAYRRAHPHCQHPDCIRLADHVDHVTPLAELPHGDPRRYDQANYMSLCQKHHSDKTIQDALRGKQRLR